jgi:PAS domain S-box-containing protein
VPGKLVGWAKQVDESTFHLHRLNIGSRLTLCFVFIILALLVGNAVSLWQFHLARTRADRLSGVDQELIAVLQAHTSLMSFYERLDVLAHSENTGQLVREVEALRNSILQESRRSRDALSRLPPEVQPDPALLPTLLSIQDTLPAELEAITALAKSNEWEAVRLRLANQVRPLESRSSELVENIAREVGEERAQAALNIGQAQRRILLTLAITAVFTLLFAVFLGWAITRSITQPLGRLMKGSTAWAKGDFSYRVPATGKDEIARLGSVFNDMIERLQELYRELQRREAYLAEAQKLSHTGSFGWDVSSGEINWSRESFRIFEYEPTAKATIDLVVQRIHPEDRSAVLQLIERVSRERTEFDFEHRLLMPDGSVKYLRVVGSPSENKGGSFEFVGAVMDVTAAKQVEQTLRESEAYLAEAQKLTHTGSGAWRVAGGDALYLSEEWYRIYGFDPQYGLSAWKDRMPRMHPEDRAKVQEIKERAISEKSDYEVEHRIILPDGTVKYTHTVGHPVVNASGDVEQFVCTMMDVTERKHAEEALHQAQADLARVTRVTTMGELTASLAHEVNQPITAAVTDARTCLRWLNRNEPDLEEAREAASRVVKDATRAAEIISRIRLLFKKGAPQRELVDMNEIIREMIVLLRGETTLQNILVGTDLAADLPPVMADRVQLQQVLMNLMINGIEAMKDVDGTRDLIICSQRGEDGQLMVCVADTGVGLPPQKTEQIFNAFFTTKPQGTGMGLRISGSIIESHGGRLWAADNSPRGASFYFTLPTKAEASE